MSERWKPEHGERYYFVDFSYFGSVGEKCWGTLPIYDSKFYEVGNVFKTKEDAEAAAEKVKAFLLSLHEPVTECNQLPKLIADVFNYPGCPEWAKYAAVDGNGCAYYYAERPSILFDEFRWESARGEDIRWKLVPVKFTPINWSESLIERPVKENKLPKLTTEVFDRADCPKWAKYAALGGGGVLVFYEDKPMMSKDEYLKRWINYDRWYPVEGTKFDASDWQNSLIERPTKKPELPDWCKVGEWVYRWDEIHGGEYCKIIKIQTEGMSSPLVHFDNGEKATYGSLSWDDVTPARLRPYNAEEMKALVGKVVGNEHGNMFLVTSFVADDGGVVCVDGVVYNADDLLECYTIDGKPCGVLEHLNEKGEWVE